MGVVPLGFVVCGGGAGGGIVPRRQDAGGPASPVGCPDGGDGADHVLGAGHAPEGSLSTQNRAMDAPPAF